MSVKITKDRVPDILRAIKDLTSKEVLVGIPDTDAGRDEGAISNAEIGYLMETGSPAQNIPERPHLVPGVESAREKIEKRLKAGAQAALSGKASDVEATLTSVGITAEKAVKQKITDGPFAPLSPKTVAARARQRKTKSQRKSEREYAKLIAGGTDAAEAQSHAGIKPLINTGKYRDAITHVVRKKGD